MVNISKIESLINLRGWSNSYFCEQFSKNKGWITDMKKGKGLPDENTLRAIADKLDTTVEYLTDQTDIKEQKNKLSSPEDSLSGNKKELFKLFDSMTDEQQETLMRVARSISPEPSSKDM